VPDRKTKTGTQRKTEASPFTVCTSTFKSKPHVLTNPYLPDTEKASVIEDPLAALEKTTDAQNHLTKVQVPRIESLQSVSEQFNADPYVHSARVRKRFREEKKVEQVKQKANDEIKGRYGLPASLSLLEDDEQTKQEAKQEWTKAKLELASNKRRRLGGDIDGSLLSSSLSSSSSANSLNSLRTRILENTARQSNPFNPSRCTTAKSAALNRK
jgi:coiled-coil domain-containing protein 130